jgi:hypothetical protein
VLHEGRHFSHFLPILLVGLEGCHFLRQRLPPAQPAGGGHKGLANCLRAAQATGLKLPKSSKCLIVEPNRDCARHETIVSRSVLLGRPPSPNAGYGRIS